MIKLHVAANSRVEVNGVRYITVGDYWSTGSTKAECINAIRHRMADKELLPGTWYDIVIDPEDMEVR